MLSEYFQFYSQTELYQNKNSGFISSNSFANMIKIHKYFLWRIQGDWAALIAETTSQYTYDSKFSNLSHTQRVCRNYIFTHTWADDMIFKVAFTLIHTSIT